MKVYQAIAAVMSDLSKVGIGKDKTNSSQNFKYRGVDDVMNVLAPMLSKHGLLILPRVTKYSCVERQSAKGNALFYTVLEVEYDFVGVEDGSKHLVGPIIGEAMDSGDKSSNKAMSIAYKYACFEAFCIPVVATDPDADVHDVSPQPWDGRQLVGFHEKFKGSMWRDVPQDFVQWVAGNPKLTAADKRSADSELKRRKMESDSVSSQGMPS